MKAFKITRIVLLTVAASVVGLGVILDTDATLALFAATKLTFGIIALLALIFTGSIFLLNSNKVVRALGVGMTAGPYVCLLGILLLSDLTTAALLCAIAAIIYAVSWLFELFCYIVSRNNKKEA